MPLLEFRGRKPNIHPSCFIAPSAVIVGDVSIGELSNIWFNAVIRADFDRIEIGSRVSIQDGVVIHPEPGMAVKVGDSVIIGHGAILHGCRIGSNVLVGFGAKILTGAQLGDWVIVAAGSVVTQDSRIESGTMVAGIPANPIKQLESRHRSLIQLSVDSYVKLGQIYLKMLSVG